jgi:hypothetical protein
MGPVAKTTGGSGACRSEVLQQIWPEQSLLCSQDLGHVCAQLPLQQMGFVASQSFDEEHFFGHDGVPAAAKAGSRHRPLAERLGSSESTVVQQISPEVVAHWLSAVQARGQLPAGKQIGCE